LKLSSVVIS